MITKTCKYCKKSFDCEQRKRKFCSPPCFYASRKGVKAVRSEKWWKSFYEAMKKTRGKPKSEEHRRKIGLAHSKIKHPWTSRRNHENRGEKSPVWKGGISPLNHKMRSNLRMDEWRIKIFQRDKYTCQSCGSKKGGILNAHHIKPFSKYPDLRTDLQNGITLCYKCHREAHRDMKGVKCQMP